MTQVIGHDEENHDCVMHGWIYPDRMVLRCAICGNEEPYTEESVNWNKGKESE